jgi:hypothetical protein
MPACANKEAGNARRAKTDNRFRIFMGSFGTRHSVLPILYCAIPRIKVEVSMGRIGNIYVEGEVFVLGSTAAKISRIRLSGFRAYNRFVKRRKND